MINILKKKDNIGKVIKNERVKMGMTQVELAKKLSGLFETEMVDSYRQKIGRWEREGKQRKKCYPSIEDLCDLSEIFKCDIKHFFGEFEEKTETVHDICKITHLSEKAVTNIIAYSDFLKFGNVINIINALLENDNYLRLLQNIIVYKSELPKIVDTSEGNYKLFDLQRDFLNVIDEITNISAVRERKKANKQKTLFELL